MLSNGGEGEDEIQKVFSEYNVCHIRAGQNVRGRTFPLPGNLYTRLCIRETRFWMNSKLRIDFVQYSFILHTQFSYFIWRHFVPVTNTGTNTVTRIMCISKKNIYRNHHITDRRWMQNACNKQNKAEKNVEGRCLCLCLTNAQQWPYCYTRNSIADILRLQKQSSFAQDWVLYKLFASEYFRQIWTEEHLHTCFATQKNSAYDASKQPANEQ